jgi:hypothetical protein
MVLTHARPKSTTIQSALDGAGIASPPACLTLVIFGSSGSASDDGVCAALDGVVLVVLV